MYIIYVYIYIYIFLYIYSYLYLQQSARYLERLYLVLKKYGNILVYDFQFHAVAIISYTLSMI